MHEYIHKYFALNKKVVLPGIGSFMAEMQNAKLDFINKTLQAPLHTIRYDQNNSADEKFYNFLSKETGLNETEAANNFNHFANELKEQLKVNHVLELKGIGTLTKNASGYSFDANNTLQDFFPEIAAERVIRQNAEHTVKVGEHHKTSTQMHKELQQRVVKKDNWFISALVLGGIGIVAIVLYYLMNK
jgi:phosphoribosyl 1,2-cyclic phosphodiesterase